jgi:hypothetical protein
VAIDSNQKSNLSDWVEATVKVLSQDVERYWDRVIESDDVFWRRGYVRAVFAYVEGLISTLKLKALLTNLAQQHKLATGRIELTKGGGFKTLVPDMFRHFEKVRAGAGFSDAEILLLKDWTYRLTDKGEVEFERAKLSLKSNLQFAFRMYAKAAGVEYSLPKGEAEWDKFKRSIKIRDRLTHPKKPADLQVSDEDMRMVAEAYVWIFDCQVAFLETLKEKRDRENPGDSVAGSTSE